MAVRSARAVAALAFGVLLGFVGVFFGAIGAVAAVALLLLGTGYFVSQRRVADLGLTVLGAGVAVLILVGRPIALSLLQPEAIEVALPSYLAASAGLLLVGMGVILLAVSSSNRPSRPRAELPHDQAD